MPGVKNLYVIRLDDAILELPAFQEQNPNYREGKPCLYVGVTSLTPEERLQQHREGYKASKKVQRFGRYLVRRKFEHLNPIPAEGAEKRERELAERLRKGGYGVWQN